MKNLVIVLFFVFGLSISSHNGPNNKSILKKVDQLNEQINTSITSFDYIINLDHHRMAAEEGVYTPPSIATIFSSSRINAELVTNSSQLMGLDLPFKMLSYTEVDTNEVLLTYTSPEFIAQRNGLKLENLASIDSELNKVIRSLGLNASNIRANDFQPVEKGFGTVKLKSGFDFETTVKNLKNIVNAQSDTRWFGEVDYQKDAAKHQKDIRPTTLLLFGGPAPGGKAMQTTPRIGLDAFCQKLLVFENDKGEVIVAFNDIVAFSELYYDTSTPPQNMINKRLTATFSKAISK